MSTLARIPTFAVVGQPNEGKTTVLATLAENDRAEISPRPGTTTAAKRYSVRIDEQEVLVLWDTPGFENSREVLRWFRQRQGDLPALFVAEFSSGQFQQEYQILRPIAEGAAILYVADASRPPRDVDRRELEILSLCRSPRIALINSKEDGSEFLKEWQPLLAPNFGLISEFNAHRATFGDRLRLLEAAATAVPAWKSALESTVHSLKEDWNSRLHRVADLMVGALAELANARETATIDRPEEKQRAQSRAKHRLEERVRAIELDFRKEVRHIFRHSAEHWELHDVPVLADDLFSGEVWELLGLTKWQLVLTAAGIGAAAGGLAVEVPTAGHSLGLGAAIGAAAGAAGAWIVSDKAVNVRIPGFKVGSWRVGDWKLGGETAVARIDPRSNLVWVLIDRFLLYTRLATSWAHGRRHGVPMAVSDHGKQGATSTWREGRKQVTTYIAQRQARKARGEKVEHAEASLRQVFTRELQRITLVG